MSYPELIAFYARYKVANIRNAPEFTAYCAANVGTLGFRDALDKTEMAKKAIEARLDAASNPVGQIRQYLNLLEAQLRLDFDRYRELISQGYKPAWSRPQQAYFEHAVRIIHSGNYFFLSFTDRDHGPETLGYKRVNRRYKYFIQRLIEQPSVSDRKKRNLLADAINIMMIDENLKGFYYKDRGNNNSVVLKALSEGSTSCLVFVQLVDYAMFDPEDPNYCEFEYRKAFDFIRQIENLAEQRVLFVVTESAPTELPDPQNVHPPYKDWLEHILRKSAVYLPPASENDKPTIAEIKSLLSGVVKQVKAARKNLLDAVPE